MRASDVVTFVVTLFMSCYCMIFTSPAQIVETNLAYNVSGIQLFPILSLPQENMRMQQTNNGNKPIKSIWDAIDFANAILREAFPARSCFPAPIGVSKTNDTYFVNYPSMFNSSGEDMETNAVNSIMFKESANLDEINIVLEPGLMPTGEPWKSLFKEVYQGCQGQPLKSK